MNVKKSVVFVIGVLVVAAVLFFNQDYEIKNYPPRGTNVIAFGDSLIEGVGATKNNDLISQVSRLTGVPIINAGVGGNTTAQGLARLETDVLSKDPKVVIVLLGGNDFLRKVDKAETFANLQQIVDRIHEKGAAVLLLGVRGGILRDTYEKDFKEFAERNRVAYVSNVLDDVLGNRELMADQIHPNDRGYAVIAQRVAPVLKKLLQ